MTLLFFEGFEGGSNGKPPELTLSGYASLDGTPRTGTVGLRMGVTSGSASAWITIPASAKVTCGFAFQPNNPNQAIVQFSGDSGATIHLTLTYDFTNNRLQLRRGNESGTILASSPTTYELGVYRHIQMQATIADSGGTCIVRQDNVEVINYTGDTRNGGTNLTIDRVTFSASFTNAGHYDDVWVCDGVDDTAVSGRPDNTFLGDLKVEVLIPNGDGASSQWLGSDGNSVQNYLLVDDVPPNTSDYVASNTAGNRDLYAMSDLSAAAATVYAVRSSVYGAKSDAGPANLKLAMRESSGTVTLSPDQVMATTYLMYFDAMRRAKPSGGPWTIAEVNALQVGVEAS